MKLIFTSIVCGFVSGVLGAFFMFKTLEPSKNLSAPTQTDIVKSYNAEQFNLYDSNRKLRAQLAMGREGGPALFLMDTKGRARVVLGVYPPSESELPFLVLNDQNNAAAGLFRLVGPKEVPYLILKHQGSDRSIYGLSPNDPSEAFIQTFGKSTTNFDLGKK